MSEITMPKRNWRYDQVDPARAGQSSALPAVDRSSKRLFSRLDRWKSLVRRWANSTTGLVREASMPPGERILHEFADVLASTDDPSQLERTLMDLARRLVGKGRFQVEWIRDPSSQAVDDAEAGRFLVRHGPRSIGQLVIRPSRGKSCRLAPGTKRRLRTLCSLASVAWARPEATAPPTPSGPGDPAACSSFSSDREGNADESFPQTACVIPGVQDATFLHAVLPYAIGQSRRHGEPLSILCVAVDRLRGIAELLGRDRADQVLRNAAMHIASQIRSSDFISRLDDGRLIAVLPRAAIDDATRVAEKLRDSVEHHAPILAEVGGVTVCIGVAEFPACASNVFDLIDAADHALSQARSRGPCQVAAAPVIRPSESVERGCFVG